MAMEPLTNDNGSTAIAMVIGVLAVLVIARFAVSAFHATAPDAIILLIGEPPAPAETPRQPLRQIANA
ncbi:MAG: hypothetical protein HOP13_05845 [Alphaproteobacteria bacterium]|jgi:hypothetical protein|nr:hypothetical protein [Alphaproteobacteria bacterium]